MQKRPIGFDYATLIDPEKLEENGNTRILNSIGGYPFVTDEDDFVIIKETGKINVITDLAVMGFDYRIYLGEALLRNPSINEDDFTIELDKIYYCVSLKIKDNENIVKDEVFIFEKEDESLSFIGTICVLFENILSSVTEQQEDDTLTVIKQEENVNEG